MVAFVRSLASEAGPKGEAHPKSEDGSKSEATPPAAPSTTPPISPRTRFHLSGFIQAHFQTTPDNGPSFSAIHFAPVMVWKLHDRVLVEAETEFGYSNGEFEVGLEYAQMHIKALDYLNFGVGLFLTPLGVYGEKLHPSWIYRMIDAPYPYQGGHDGGVMPSSGLGGQAYGAIPTGKSSSISYKVFVINGPGAVDGEFSTGGLVPDNNWNKFAGGRLAFAPVRQIEFGVSGTTGKWDDDSTLPYGALVGDIMASHDGFHFQGEFISTWLGETVDEELEKRLYWWVQAGYRLVTLPGEWSNFELVTRYGGAKLPAEEGAHDEPDAVGVEDLRLSLKGGAPSGGDDDHGTQANSGLPEGSSHQIAFGINYYPWSSVAVRMGGHYTVPTNHWHAGLTLAVGL